MPTMRPVIRPMAQRRGRRHPRPRRRDALWRRRASIERPGDDRREGEPEGVERPVDGGHRPDAQPGGTDERPGRVDDRERHRDEETGARDDGQGGRRTRRERPGDGDGRQPDPEPAGRGQDRADPVRGGEAEEPERRRRDADDDRPGRDLEPATRPACEGQRTREREREPGEVEVDHREGDDVGREPERLDPEPIREREGGTDREEAEGRGDRMRRPGPEQLGRAQKPNAGDRGCHGRQHQPREWRTAPRVRSGTGSSARAGHRRRACRAG